MWSLPGIFLSEASFEAGKPAVNFAVATRYLHSHNSMIERADLDQAVDLLVKILPRLDAKTVAEISRFELQR